jgi:predicted cobalt transporter CbtA
MLPPTMPPAIALPPMLPCPCGEDHTASTIWKLVTFIVEAKGEHVTVHVEGIGSWHVPRVYLAFHGLVATELPALADRYGWAREDADAPD